MEEGAHKKPGTVQHVPASGTFFITLGRVFPLLSLGHRFSGLGLSCLFSRKWCIQKPKCVREGSDFGCSWEVEGLGNPRAMRSVLGRDSQRGAIREERGLAMKVLPSAVRAGDHRDFWLVTASLRSTLYPWKK